VALCRREDLRGPTMVRAKRPHHVAQEDSDLDVLYYNQLLGVLRDQQERGEAFYGNFVHDPKPVLPEAYAEWLPGKTASLLEPREDQSLT